MLIYALYVSTFNAQHIGGKIQFVISKNHNDSAWHIITQNIHSRKISELKTSVKYIIQCDKNKTIFFLLGI